MVDLRRGIVWIKRGTSVRELSSSLMIWPKDSASWRSQRKWCRFPVSLCRYLAGRERRTSDQKKYFNSSEPGVLSTTANSNPGSVDTGTGCAVREQHKQDFDQNQDSVPSYS